MKKFLSDRHFHLWLLLGWMAIGLLVRFTDLNGKPPWTDEFATMVFSLGHSFRSIPLDQVISTDALLEPLRPTPDTTVHDVVTQLLTESTHPPIYFVLTHAWLKLFPVLPQGIISVWVTRSLAALIGVFTIPAIFALGYLAFDSLLVAQLSAGMMALSPYATFLAQDSRHYTLAILLVTLSLTCLVKAVRCVRDRTPIPLWLCLLWIVTNTLGIATHYFFSLTLVAEALALALLASWNCKSSLLMPAVFLRLGFVGSGSLLGGLVWLPELLQSNSSRLTDWIFFDRTNLLMWLNPIFQFCAGWVTMFSLMPVEADFIPLAVVSGAVMLTFFIWLIPLLMQGIKAQLADSEHRWAVQLLGGVVMGALAVFVVIIYGLGRDLTRGARYNFVYFPAVLVLAAAALAVFWQMDRLPVNARMPAWRAWVRSQFPQTGRKAVLFILLVGFLGCLSVAVNLGYEKYYRPELLEGIMRQYTEAPMLVATSHKTHVQTGEIMGIARQFKLAKDASPYTNPRFLLAHQNTDPQESTQVLNRVLAQQARPVDLWLINFQAPIEVESQGCAPVEIKKIWIHGYGYDLYRCR